MISASGLFSAFRIKLGKYSGRKGHSIRKLFVLEAESSNKLLTHLSTKNVNLSKNLLFLIS
ncbi:MAG: hypothetical protein A2V64_00550 [Bacteroidetes bacterium RBG_13_43_22]|nr:MAG: hypothetical protein A2V64_00550 [Bacteroidetes bacterium RBG_13_43_22]